VGFSSSRTGNYQLWEVPAAGGEARRLRSNGATEYQADLSPDGKELAFLSNLDGPGRLLMEDLASGAVRELVRHGRRTIFGNPHWSPDGRFITYSSNRRIGHQIYVVEVATGKERRISGPTGGGCEPRFSRDGRKVTFGPGPARYPDYRPLPP
jgi:TolB protein